MHVDVHLQLSPSVGTPFRRYENNHYERSEVAMELYVEHSEVSLKHQYEYSEVARMKHQYEHSDVPMKLP